MIDFLEMFKCIHIHFLRSRSLQYNDRIVCLQPFGFSFHLTKHAGVLGCNGMTAIRKRNKREFT